MDEGNKCQPFYNYLENHEDMVDSMGFLVNKWYNLSSVMLSCNKQLPESLYIAEEINMKRRVVVKYCVP